MNIYAILIIVAILSLLNLGCEQKQEQVTGPRYGVAPASNALPVYHFAVHPLHNPVKLMNAYQPLIEYLNARISGGRFILESSRDYASFEKKYQRRDPEIILPNPWQTLQAMKSGYSVIATAGERRDFKGIFIVRKDSDIKRPSDLKGKAVSYPSPTALAACIMPQYFLHTHGINVNSDIDNRYVGSQESSIMNVYAKKTAVGATWPPPWRAFKKSHPEEAAALRVIWETPPLINNSVMIRNYIPVALRDQVLKLLAGLHKNTEGKVVLDSMETSRFIPAADRDYAVVRSYIERFEKDVRKVEEKNR